MFTFISRTLVRPAVLACILFSGTTAALAQVPQSTPRPTPAPGDPSRPPSQQPIPGTTPTPNPAAPPGAPQTNPAAPPGAIPVQTPVPGQSPAPGQTPAPTSPTGEPLPTTPQEPLREPVIPQFQPKPLPPVPSLNRLGIGSETVTLTLNDAIKRALENNNDIEVARDDVRIAETQLRALEGVFDPVFAITPTYDKRIAPQQSSLGGGSVTSTTVYAFDPGVVKQFGKGGGNYFLSFNTDRTDSSNSFNRLNPFYSSNLALQFTQPLLRNRSIDNNRRQIRIQRKRLDQSDADFRQRTIEVITRVQQAYWELVFALRDQQNQLSNLNLSRESLRNIEAQIAAGARAPLERAEVLTEVSNRETALLSAIQSVAVAENNLKVLIFKEPTSPEWSAQLTPTETPKFDTTPVNLDDALKAARDNRPELRRLRLQNEINDIDISYFKNQTKPRIDLVGTVALTGLAGTAVGDVLAPPVPGTLVPLIFGDPLTNSSAFLFDQIRAIQLAQGLPVAVSPLVPADEEAQLNQTLIGGYGQNLRNLFSGDTRNIRVGVTIQFPFKNKTAEANLAGARIQKEQLLATTRGQQQTIEVDVRNSAQAVESSRQRVLSAREARVNAEMQLEGEQRLYQVGRSTTFLLFQRENALANARASELRAETDYNKALADLQRATSTTLRANNVIVETPAVP